MTVKQIAAELGISPTTVSLVLNGKAERYGIAEKTQKRVRDFAKEAAYVPDANAVAMRRRDTQSIGILIPRYMTDRQRDLFVSLIHELPDRGLESVIHAVDHGSLTKTIRSVIGKRVKRIVFIGQAAGFSAGNTEVQALLRKCENYFLDYFYYPNQPLPLPEDHAVYIGMDRNAAYSAALQTFADMGHKAVAIDQHGRGELLRHAENMEGFRVVPAACAPHVKIAESTEWLPELAEELKVLIRDEGVTGYMAGNDHVAIELIARLAEVGIRVPDDLSLLGFGNIRVAPYSRVPLSSIDLPTDDMRDILYEHLFSGNPPNCRQHVLPGKVIVRDSLQAV